MKKTMLSLLSVAVVLPTLSATENSKKEQKPEEKQQQKWNKRYNEAIEKQMQERSRAFNEDNIQANHEEFIAFISRQRERIMSLVEEKTKTR